MELNNKIENAMLSCKGLHYSLVESQIEDETVYGIKVVCKDEEKLIENIFVKKEEVQALISYLSKSDIDFMHVSDVIYDYVVAKYS